MTGRFTSFVILGAMRTGSNYLESSLNELPGVRCHGELFNPAFVGTPGQSAAFGVSAADRDAEPARLLAALRAQGGPMPGFRLFPDHDPRVLPLVLADPACAKIVLTRNPLDSFVSLEIANATGQWILRDPARRRSERIRFDPARFAAYLGEIADWRRAIRRGLQAAGQTGFWIAYDDLGDVAALNGLAAWLGLEGRLDAPSDRLARQNPEPVSDKVTNPAEMEAAVAALDPAAIWDSTPAEPLRGPMIPTWVAAPGVPLLFAPIPGGPQARIEGWLAALSGQPEAAFQRGFTRKTLRGWRRTVPGHRIFTAVRHPTARAHAVFCTAILPATGTGFERPREVLRSRHGLPLPEGDPGPGWTRADHRRAFVAWLGFVQANLAGQTALRTDPAWATQETLLHGLAEAQPPDHVLRAERLGPGLAALAAEIGREAPPVPPAVPDAPYSLMQVHDPDIEAAVRAAYARDYLAFGYDAWTPLTPP